MIKENLNRTLAYPAADSLIEFARETMLDTYPSFGDTTIAIGTGGGIIPPPDTCFKAIGPYENPSVLFANDVSILVHYCGLPAVISAQVYTSLGIPVGSATTYLSDGVEWDKLPIYSPPAPRSYHIAVTVGAYSTTLGYIVY
jgi:hypothetical protein